MSEINSINDLFYDSPEFQDTWPPVGVVVEEWIKTQPAIEFRRNQPDGFSTSPPLIPDHCRHPKNVRTIAGLCLYCGSFPEGNQFKQAITP